MIGAHVTCALYRALQRSEDAAEPEDAELIPQLRYQSGALRRTPKHVASDCADLAVRQ